MNMNCAKKAQSLSSRVFRNVHALSITSFTPTIQLEEFKSNFVSILVQFLILIESLNFGNNSRVKALYFVIIFL